MLKISTLPHNVCKVVFFSVTNFTIGEEFSDNPKFAGDDSRCFPLPVRLLLYEDATNVRPRVRPKVIKNCLLEHVQQKTECYCAKVLFMFTTKLKIVCSLRFVC